ncbi:MAG: CoB--CoM heterodisulfide reductase iron-sulfur subunit A [Candidatus Methanophagaceae archaeon]|nr:MAG: CoB--CoM heterodisulfide reductase iron-sulfur subunit A [Methanophagales archaeon]
MATVVSGVKKVAKTGDGCIGCGSCASYCPSGAMSLKYFKDKQVYAQFYVKFNHTIPGESIFVKSQKESFTNDILYIIYK